MNNDFHIIPFTGENRKWCIWSRNSISRPGIKICDVLITGDKKDYSKETKLKVVSELKLLNKTAYNELVLAQEDMFYFMIVEEVKTKANNSGDARQAWMKFSEIFDPTTGASSTIPRNKFAKFILDDVTRTPNNGSLSSYYSEDNHEKSAYTLTTQK